MQESEIIRYLKDQEGEIVTDLETEKGLRENRYDTTIGDASEIGSGTLSSDAYLNTELIRIHKEEQKMRDKKIEELQRILNIDRSEALSLLNQSEGEKSEIKRPDKYFAKRKKDIDVKIKEDIVPGLLVCYSIDKQSDYIRNSSLFKYKYSWIPGFLEKTSCVNNAALLAMYFTNYLNTEIGKKKKDWKNSDYDIAYEKLEMAVDYVNRVLEEFTEDLK